MTGLYIHVPLCISRCRYCDFYKLTPKEWDNVAAYLLALETELSRLPEDFVPETVFIGGGTPTALSPPELHRLLGAVARRFDVASVEEYSCEANPGTLTTEKLSILREGGVNRISIGVQSFNPRALRLLGRIHTPGQAVEGVRMARAAGFDNLNIDLIQSIPGMAPADVIDDALRAAELAPEHIAYYNLIYEPGTPLTRDRDEGRVVPPGDDEEADNYYAVKDALAAAGYAHYEISNFTRAGRECLHNVLYWQGGEYLGCGPSAHSHWKGRRFGNVPDVHAYCQRMGRGEKPFDETESLPPRRKARETLVMWLRMLEGVNAAHFEKVAGITLEMLCGAEIAALVEEGLLGWNGGQLALTREALFICNSVFSELVHEEDAGDGR